MPVRLTGIPPVSVVYAVHVDAFWYTTMLSAVVIMYQSPGDPMSCAGATLLLNHILSFGGQVYGGTVLVELS